MPDMAGAASVLITATMTARSKITLGAARKRREIATTTITRRRTTENEGKGKAAVLRSASRSAARIAIVPLTTSLAIANLPSMICRGQMIAVAKKVALCGKVMKTMKIMRVSAPICST